MQCLGASNDSIVEGRLDVSLKMCIRDRVQCVLNVDKGHLAALLLGFGKDVPVSYTHLVIPVLGEKCGIFAKIFSFRIFPL